MTYIKDTQNEILKALMTKLKTATYSKNNNNG